MPHPAKPTVEQMLQLLTEVMLPFHSIARQIDLPLSPPRPENDVEHSWSVALMACCLAPAVDPQLDVGKIAQLAIAHDLVEVFAGDIPIFATAADLKSKAAREHEAFVKLRDRYSAFPWLAATIAEYEARESPEAKFVSAVDKLVALQLDSVNNGAYLPRLGVTVPQYFASLETPTKKGHLHPAIGDYYDQVLERIHSRSDFGS